MPNSNMSPRPDLFYFLTVSSHCLLKVTHIRYLRLHLLTQDKLLPDNRSKKRSAIDRNNQLQPDSVDGCT